MQQPQSREGVGAYFFLGILTDLSKFALPFAGGALLYVASSDLIPELHEETKTSANIMQIITLVAGVLVMYGLKMYFG